MRYHEKEAALNPLREALAALEAQAGITEEMERARDYNFMPLGIDGEKVSSDEYFADEHDGRRDRTRKAYFGVADIELRQKLIKADREFDKKIEEHSEDDLREANSAVIKAKTAAAQQPWGLAAIIAIVAVAIGYKVYDVVGAIAGAVGGFFLAMGAVKNKQAETAAALAQAEQELAELKKSQYVSSLSPENFNHMEQLTGEEDREFGHENARWNVLEFEKQQKAKAAGDLR
jgi:hypothetical protein